MLTWLFAVNVDVSYFRTVTIHHVDVNSVERS